MERMAWLSFSTVILMCAPMAERFVFTPASLTVIQSLSLPGFLKTRKAWASPGVAPPESRRISSWPLFPRSAKAIVFSCVVAKQRVGSHCAVFGTASPYVNVQESVVIDVAKVGAHG